MSSAFQTVVLIVFGGAIVVAVLVFSGIIPGFGLNKASVAETVTVWGTMPTANIDRVLSPLNTEYRDQFSIQYIEKLPVNFENDLVQALASGAGPDLVILPSDLLQKNKTKLVSVSEESWPVRDFMDTFSSGSEVLVDEQGVWGVPLLANPLVLYYNRSVLASAGISEPPKTWSQLLVDAPKVTAVTDKGEVTKSYVAMGRASNVLHLKDILATMFFQLGNHLVVKEGSGQLTSTLDRGLRGSNSNPTSALIYFLQFADPVKTVYSWNSSLPEDRQAFAAGNLALYMGLASDLRIIQQLNPNLDFDVAVIPQRDLTNQVTAGRIFMASITREGAKKQTGLSILKILASREIVSQLVASLGLPPVRRDLLASEVSDPYLAIFYRSSLIMKDWFDPDPALSKDIFNQMVQNAGSGRVSVGDALSNASNQLLNLVRP